MTSPEFNSVSDLLKQENGAALLEEKLDEMGFYLASQFPTAEELARYADFLAEVLTEHADDRKILDLLIRNQQTIMKPLAEIKPGKTGQGVALSSRPVMVIRAQVVALESLYEEMRFWLGRVFQFEKDFAGFNNRRVK